MENIIKELLDEIKNGNAIWTKTWALGEPINGITQAPYKGFNIWALLYVQNRNNYQSNEWAGYNQWKKAGIQVNKGEKGTAITVFISPKMDESGDTIRRGFFKPSYVFNRNQTNAPKEESPVIDACKEADSIIYNLNLNVSSGNPAYSPSRDVIYMPSMQMFTSGEMYYASFFHEITHWTGHSARLNRKGIVDAIKFGSEKYAREELIAEIGACLLSQFTNNLTEESKCNSGAYLRGWLQNANESDIDGAILNALEEARKAYQFVIGGN